MPNRLPPLNALRAFEAAGRHASFSRAAAELEVTPGAISRQVTLLEEHLSARLFERGHRKVVLTEDGRAFLETVTDVLGRVGAAVARFTGTDRERPLHIFCSMMFTVRWLLPRFAAFESTFSSRIRFSTSISPGADPFGDGDVDAAIYLGGDRPKLTCHRLFPSRLTPICSPALLQHRTLTRPEDLAQFTLLHSAVYPANWRNWFAMAGLGSPDAAPGVTLGSTALCYQAAIEGLGVALGQEVLIEEDLASGRLVRPVAPVLEDGNAYMLAYRAEARSDEPLDMFVVWLLEEVARAGS